MGAYVSEIRRVHLYVVPDVPDTRWVADDRRELEGLLAELTRRLDAIENPFYRGVLRTWQQFLERALRGWR